MKRLLAFALGLTLLAASTVALAAPTVPDQTKDPLVQRLESNE